MKGTPGALSCKHCQKGHCARRRCHLSPRIEKTRGQAQTPSHPSHLGRRRTGRKSRKSRDILSSPTTVIRFSVHYFLSALQSYLSIILFVHSFKVVFFTIIVEKRNKRERETRYTRITTTSTNLPVFDNFNKRDPYKEGLTSEAGWTIDVFGIRSQLKERAISFDKYSGSSL